MNIDPRSYLNDFLNSLGNNMDLVNRIKSFDGPIDKDFFNEENTNPSIFFSLPSINIFRNLFSNFALDERFDPIFLNGLQEEFATLFPKTLDRHWQYVRRREYFTSCEISTSSYVPSLILEFHEALNDNDFVSLDKILLGIVDANIDLHNSIRKYNMDSGKKLKTYFIDIDSPVEYSLLSKQKKQFSSITVAEYRFETSGGFTRSYWNLNNDKPPYIEILKTDFN